MNWLTLLSGAVFSGGVRLIASMAMFRSAGLRWSEASRRGVFAAVGWSANNL
jgi:hypothetical protein